jgi:ribosome-associated protein
MFKDKEITVKNKAAQLADFLHKEKNVKVVVLDLKKISYTFDYLIICCVDTARRAAALYKAALKFSRKNKLEVYYYQDDSSGQWFVLDYFDFAVHIFTDEAYHFYKLERLWKQARKVEFSQSLNNQKD